MTEPMNRPSKVTHEDDEVFIDGPDGVAVSMTPEAALETAKSLEQAAVQVIIERATAAEGAAATAEGGVVQDPEVATDPAE